MFMTGQVEVLLEEEGEVDGWSRDLMWISASVEQSEVSQL